jgi:four helix bundle protein
MRNFMDLRVWQEAHTLTLSLYRLTKSFPKDELYGLTSQIRRSCISIEANLAEGCGRRSDAELGRFVQIAMGSASELACHLLVARDLSLVAASDYQESHIRLTRVRRMLTSLLQSIENSSASRRQAKSQQPRAKSQAAGE